MLKKTAVACHWIRGLEHSELLWTAGDARAFNAQGAVPTNTTTRNILRGEDENDWHMGQDIYLLAGLAALLHDLGKASRAFQMRLQSLLQERNQCRQNGCRCACSRRLSALTMTTPGWRGWRFHPALGFTKCR